MSRWLQGAVSDCAGHGEVRKTMSNWAGFRFVNLPDERDKYLQALKDAHIVAVKVGNLVLALCGDGEGVGDIVPMTEILHRTVDMAAIAKLPREQGRLVAYGSIKEITSARFDDDQIAEMEDAIIKSGQHGPDQDGAGVRGEEGPSSILR